ncbi:hypothetical protein [Leptolyngbya sp. PCC 6406]|uniref:hypothetical protein n=1 Tax=Leptolyngbya sp. PCC 6406 TaxID=1173264 RepID=UPI0002ABF8B0|nr:hypothetical protein [Leptolyngbya sp. PCC 6406]
MALSRDCLQQHLRGQVLTQRWAIFGVLGVTGLHLGLMPIMGWTSAQMPDVTSCDRIQLMVLSPEVNPAAEPLASLSLSGNHLQKSP